MTRHGLLSGLVSVLSSLPRGQAGSATVLMSCLKLTLLLFSVLTAGMRFGLMIFLAAWTIGFSIFVTGLILLLVGDGTLWLSDLTVSESLTKRLWQLSQTR